MTTPNQYTPDDRAAARILAAFAALGNEIAALQLELQQQRERADEYQRTAMQLSAENKHLHAQLVKPGVWDDMQRAMVQSGIELVRHESAFTWLAQTKGDALCYKGDTLADAAKAASDAWRKAQGLTVIAPECHP